MDDEIIKAAGGLVWRVKDGLKQIAIVHRTRYSKDEWTLPKGKLHEGESWVEAAKREVSEEVGCDKVNLKVNDFADLIYYVVEGVPKVVLFWNMILKEDNCTNKTDTEVDQVKWLPVEEAKKLLVHDKEKAILK